MYKEFFVDADDVKLYCRCQGTGEPVLLIHGACVDCDFFRDSAEVLATQFTVISYDRRGYGRSSDPENGNHSFWVQAEDAAQIIPRIGQPCHIVAHSAGALVAMELAELYPELTKRIFLYEPGVLDCLPESHRMYSEFLHVYDLIQKKNHLQAFIRFIPTFEPQDVRARPSTDDELAHMQRNSMCFIRKEYEYYFTSKRNYEILSKASITIGVGKLSRNSHHWSIANALSSRISSELIYFPGGHNCPYDLPWEFSCLTAGILK